MTTELRSRPTSKNVRLALEDGVAEVAVAPKWDGRATFTISHTKLASSDDVAHWRRSGAAQLIGAPVRA